MKFNLKKKDNEIKARYKYKNETGEVPDGDGIKVGLDVQDKGSLSILRYEKIDDFKIPVNSSLTIKALNNGIEEIKISNLDGYWKLEYIKLKDGKKAVVQNNGPDVNVEIGGV